MHANGHYDKPIDAICFRDYDDLDDGDDVYSTRVCSLTKA